MENYPYLTIFFCADMEILYAKHITNLEDVMMCMLCTQ